MSNNKKIFQERTEKVLAKLRLATAQQSSKSYRGNSKDRSVSFKISGKHEVEEVRLDEKLLELDPELCRDLEEKITEAANRALKRSQKAVQEALAENIEID